MGVLIDSSVLIAAERGSVDLEILGREQAEVDFAIAATAIARGLDVVTRDERSFPLIPGLTVIRW